MRIATLALVLSVLFSGSDGGRRRPENLIIGHRAVETRPRLFCWGRIPVVTLCSKVSCLLSGHLTSPAYR